eukprot:scaffold31591_cov73-Skeletonema_marinoi.AAC.1
MALGAHRLAKQATGQGQGVTPTRIGHGRQGRLKAALLQTFYPHSAMPMVQLSTTRRMSSCVCSSARPSVTTNEAQTSLSLFPRFSRPTFLRKPLLAVGLGLHTLREDDKKLNT